MSESENQISIPFDRKRMRRKLFGAIALMMGGILYIFIPLINTHLLSNQFSNQTFTIVGCFFIIGSFNLAYHSLKRLTSSKPGFLINLEGIQDYSGTFHAGAILWSDITKVRIIKILWRRIIVVVVNNPQTYINKQRNWLNKLPMSINDVIFKSPFCINTEELNISLNDLFEQIDSNLKRHNERLQ